MMKIMNGDISDLDLNLLRVLDAVLREGSATGAARRLHVTQSAVSNSLARLRDLFGDPLMERDGRGLAPTPLARRLMPDLSRALAQVGEAVMAQLVFDPRASRRRFTLACTDAHHFHDVPRVAARFARALPRADLRIVSPDYLESSDGLATGEIDAALIPRPGVPAGLPCEDLYHEGFAFVVRKGHPVAGKVLTVERFNRLRHVDTLIVQGRGGAGSATRWPERLSPTWASSGTWRFRCPPSAPPPWPPPGAISWPASPRAWRTSSAASCPSAR
jgi:DNA-binding transcriptional LysR family regulator